MTEITREPFAQQRSPRFGNQNPERMRMEFWEWMIRGDHREESWNFEEGRLLGVRTPFAVRQLLHIELDCADGPTWTFDRLGATQTTLPDGRLVCIGGEHEDFYDPDFCIYNDVVVLGPSGATEIYGYPKKVFPPTDFHTASLVGSGIIVIGCIGYKDERRHGYTAVYRLDVGDFHMTEIVSSGDMPGWMAKHTAGLEGETIRVAGGEVVLKRDGREVYRPNIEEFALDIASGSWRRLTNRNWRQFAICMEDRRMFDMERWPKPKLLLPEGVEYSLVECDSLLGAQIAVRDVRIVISVEISEIRILVEGDLPAELVRRLVESVRSRAQSTVGDACSVEEL